MLRHEQFFIVSDQPDPEQLLDQLRATIRDLSAMAEFCRKDAARGRRLLLRSGSIDAALDWARQKPEAR